MCGKLRTVVASNNRDHMPQSLYCCLFVPCIYSVFLHTDSILWRTVHSSAMPVEWLEKHPLIFTKKRTDHTFFVWRLNPAQPSYPGHSTILLRSESLSGMCAKLRTVVASNNRDHMLRSLYYCLFMPRIYSVFLRAHSVRGEPRISMQCQQSGCNNKSDGKNWWKYPTQNTNLHNMSPVYISVRVLIMLQNIGVIICCFCVFNVIE